MCLPSGEKSWPRISHLPLVSHLIGRSGPPWPKPCYRGLGDLVFAGFNSENSLLLDLGKRRVFGRLSPAMGADQAYWRTLIFPNLLTLLGPTIGLTELHCACVAQNGGGILLWGAAGSGKRRWATSRPSALTTQGATVSW